MLDTIAHRPRTRAHLPWQALTLAILLLAFGLRLYYATSAGAFVDEPTTLLVARAIATSGLPILPSGLFYGNDLPFSYLAGAVLAVTGLSAAHGLLAVRLLTVAAAVGTVLVVAVAGRRFFGPWAGVWAALLLALDPDSIVWGGRARAYGVLGLLAIGGLALFYAAVAQSSGLRRRGTGETQSRGLRHTGPAVAQSSGLRRRGTGETQSRGLRHTGLAVAQSSGLRRAGLALLVVALFVHPEAALLLPAVAIMTTLLRGVRWWLAGTQWLEMALALAAAAGRYALQLALARGTIGSFETVAGSRPPIEIAAGPLAALREIAPFFASPERLPWTVLAVIGTAAAVLACLSGRRSARVRATLFFSGCLWIVPAGMILFFGQTYQSPRYLAFLIPVLALAAAAGLSWLAALSPKPGAPTWQRALPTAILSLILLVAYLPGAVRAAGKGEKGFAEAMAYVAEAWQPGDRVATVAPATCYVYLGHCDYFALGIDYEEFVYRDTSGQLVDRWLGTPLTAVPAQLNQALQGSGRLWLIVDEGRLRTRFDAVFREDVWQRMEPVARTGDVLVFRSVDLATSAAGGSVGAVLDDTVALVAYALPGQDGAPAGVSPWGDVVARPGDSVPLVLSWQALAPVPYESAVFVHLLGPDGTRYAQDDGPPLGGVLPMTHWLPGEVMPDRRTLDLPADLRPGRYQLVAGLYDPVTGRRPVTGADAARVRDDAVILDYVQVLDAEPVAPAPAVTTRAELTGGADAIRLLGYDLPAASVPPGGSLALTLYWQAEQPVAANYTTFVHLLDEENEIQSQDDGPPLGGFYPTSFWDPGEIVVDRRVVQVDPAVPPGSYRVAVGLYVLDPPRRLQTAEGDRVVLGEVEVTR